MVVFPRLAFGERRSKLTAPATWSAAEERLQSCVVSGPDEAFLAVPLRSSVYELFDDALVRYTAIVNAPQAHALRQALTDALGPPFFAAAEGCEWRLPEALVNYAPGFPGGDYATALFTEVAYGKLRAELMRRDFGF